MHNKSKVSAYASAHAVSNPYSTHVQQLLHAKATQPLLPLRSVCHELTLDIVEAGIPLFLSTALAASTICDCNAAQAPSTQHHTSTDATTKHCQNPAFVAAVYFDTKDPPKTLQTTTTNPAKNQNKVCCQQNAHAASPLLQHSPCLLLQLLRRLLLHLQE